MDVLISLGNRIKQLRKNLKLTQADLADKAGLSTNFIALLEKGKRSASVDTLLRISKVLKVELKDLFDFPEKKTKAQAAIDELLKILKRKSADDIDVVKEIAVIIFRGKSPRKR